MGVRFLNFDDGYSSATDPSPSALVSEIYSTKYLEATLQTTDGFSNTLLDFQTVSDKAYIIICKGGGLRDDSLKVSAYDSRAVFRNDGGVLTQTSNELQFSSEDDPSTDFVITSSGIHIRLEVTGATSEIYNWLFNIQILVFP